MCKLSIIIPVYNVESYLEKCLLSVLDKNSSDYEIVLVNDGSTDRSPAICEDYARRYPGQIRYLSTPNGGLGAARNVGIRHAQGDYLLFLDSDDYLAENAIPEILDMLRKEADIFVFDFMPVTEEGRSLGCTKGSEQEGFFTLREYPEFLFCPPNACNKIWSRRLFAESGIQFPGRLWFEDLYTIPKLYLLADSICYESHPWYQYLYRPGSITQTKKVDRCGEIVQAVDSILDFYREQGAFERYQQALEYMALYHQVITSTTRINLIDPKSPLQQDLFLDFRTKFPHYRKNPYTQAMPLKFKLLLAFIERSCYRAFHYTMRLNNYVKGKTR